MPSQDEKGAGSRVRQFLRGMQQIFAKDVKIQSTEDPEEVVVLSKAFNVNQALLQRLVATGPEMSDACADVTGLRKAFGSALENLGKTRSEDVSAATRGIAAVLRDVDDARERCDAYVMEFCKALSALEAGKVAIAKDQLGMLDAARAELDSAIGKQQDLPVADAEKAEQRKRRLTTSKQSYQDSLQKVLNAVPQAEMAIESALCSALASLVQRQAEEFENMAALMRSLQPHVELLKCSYEETSQLLAGGAARQIAAQAAVQMGATPQNSDSVNADEARVADACAPRMIELLSAPNFAVAMALAEVCASWDARSENPPTAMAGGGAVGALLRVIDDVDLVVPLLKLSIGLNMPRGTRECVLFRTPSTCLSLCRVAVEVVSRPYLLTTLAPPIQHICSGEADFEVDERFLNEDDDREANMDNLCKAVQWLFDTVGMCMYARSVRVTSRGCENGFYVCLCHVCMYVCVHM
jgi:hypothetical protein